MTCMSIASTIQYFDKSPKMPTYNPVVKVLGTYSDIVTGRPSSMSGSANVLVGCHMYCPSPSLSFAMLRIASRWNNHSPTFMYCGLHEDLAFINPSSVIAVVVFPRDTSRPVDMPDAD